MNVKQLLEVMAKAGWTPQEFRDAINSKIRLDASLKRTDAEEVTPEQAERFLARGDGLSSPQFDLLETWVAARMGIGGSGAMSFPKPQPTQTLHLNMPPVIVAADPPVEDVGVGAFTDQTNYRARQKMIAAG